MPLAPHRDARCARRSRRELRHVPPPRGRRAGARGAAARAPALRQVAWAREGDGSCIGFQLGRCRGVCVGREPPALHAVRARLALAGLKRREWPFAGPIGIRERDWRGVEETHVFDRWCHDDEPFDLDIYRILTGLPRPPAPRRRAPEAGRVVMRSPFFVTAAAGTPTCSPQSSPHSASKARAKCWAASPARATSRPPTAPASSRAWAFACCGRSRGFPLPTRSALYAGVREIDWATHMDADGHARPSTSRAPCRA